jgi:hypothetical protein
MIIETLKKIHPLAIYAFGFVDAVVTAAVVYWIIY